MFEKSYSGKFRWIQVFSSIWRSKDWTITLVQSVLLFIAMNVALYSDAQLPSFRQYTTENGLTCSTIYRCIEDSKGFMWFGTENGVMRFDGHFFDAFSMKDGLSDNEIFNIFEDSKGRIWFLTFNGKLSYYLDGVIINETQDSSLAKCYCNAGFQSAFEDYYGNLWFSALDGSLFIKSEQQVKHLTLFQNGTIPISDYCAKTNVAFPIHGEKDSTLYIHYRDNIFKYDYASGMAHSIKEIPFVCGSLFNLKSKNKAIGVNYGRAVNSISGDVTTPMHIELSFDLSWLEKTHENLIVSYNNKTTHLISIKTGESRRILTDITVNYIYSDRQENIWFCTRNEGILQISKNALHGSIWDKKSGLSSTNIHSVHVRNSECIWVGLDNGELTRIKNGVVSNIPLTSNTPINSRALIFVKGKEGDIMIGSDVGIDMINSKDELVKPIGNFHHQLGAVKSLTFSKDSNIQFAATSNGLYKFSQYPFKNSTEQLEPIFQRRFAAYIDKNGKLWHCTLKGLYLSDPEKINFALDPLICSERIFKVIDHGDSTVMAISESAGIFIIRDKQIVDRLTITDNNYQISYRDLYANNDQILVATNHGIYEFEKKGDQWNQIRKIAVGEGLPSNEVNAVLLYAGKIYAGTSRGLAIIPLDTPPTFSEKSTVYIRNVSGSWGSTRDYSSISIAPDHNNLNIEFSAISLFDNAHITFYYSLNDSLNWFPAEGHNLALTHLPYGMNTVAIVAKDKEGALSMPVFLNVNVLAPYWNKTWFQIILLFVLLTLATTLYYLWSKQRFNEMKQKLLVNNERSRISADLHDDIGADLTRINLMAELLKHSSKNSTLISTAQKIINESRNLRTKADQIIWALTPENDNSEKLMSYLNHYGSQLFENGNIKFHFQNSVPSEIKMSALKRRNLFLIVKEAFNNAQKHSGASVVTFNASESRGNLEIIIRDNGKGVISSNNESNFRSGMRNMRKRTIELQGEIVFANSSPQGYTVMVKVPFIGNKNQT